MEERRNVITFLNMKGGVCKTTLCREIAFHLFKNDRKLLIIDIDPQANCTQSFFEKYSIIKADEDESLFIEYPQIPSIEKVFTKPRGNLKKPDLDDIICHLDIGLDLIPGDLNTVFMEREHNGGAAEQRLFNFIEENSLKSKYDYIFIDCPPTYSFYTIAALISSNYYFVPVKPDAYSLLGLDLLERVIKEIVESRPIYFINRPLINLGIIFTQIPSNPSKGMLKNVNQIKEAFSKENLYFFENKYLYMDKIANSRLSTFIDDRDDIDLKSNLNRICIEFEERMIALNGQILNQ